MTASRAGFFQFTLPFSIFSQSVAYRMYEHICARKYYCLIQGRHFFSFPRLYVFHNITLLSNGLTAFQKKNFFFHISSSSVTSNPSGMTNSSVRIANQTNWKENKVKKKKLNDKYSSKVKWNKWKIDLIESRACLILSLRVSFALISTNFWKICTTGSLKKRKKKSSK